MVACKRAYSCTNVPRSAGCCLVLIDRIQRTACSLSASTCLHQFTSVDQPEVQLHGMAQLQWNLSLLRLGSSQQSVLPVSV